MMRRRFFNENDPPLGIRLSPRQSKKKKTEKSIAVQVVFLLLFSFVAIYFFELHLLFSKKKAVNEPLFTKFDNDFEKNMDRFWGTYRPQVYLGMKTKSERSLVTGLMWLQQHVRYNAGELPVKHVCEHGDRLKKYGWESHDGVNFGIQRIVESDYELKTEFAKMPGGEHGGDWTWRISAVPNVGSKPTLLSLFFYAATDGQGSLKPVVKKQEDQVQLIEIKGNSEELGSFTIKLPEENNGKPCRYHVATSRAEGLHKINDALLRRMHVLQDASRKQQPYYFISQNDQRGDPPNSKSDIVFHQVSLELPFEIEIVFESGSNQNRSSSLAGEKFTKQLNIFKKQFDKKFEETFPLKSKGYSKDEVKFAKSAFSNMIGGIGHFYGSSLVRSDDMKEAAQYWPAHLLTAVPSRSFFPRGFLWDEGFHQLLIGKWSKEVSMDIIQHWLNLINHEGWIPREQILGSEARSKVPDEFVVQRSSNANPPTLFLAIESIVESGGDEVSQTSLNFLSKIYPRLKVWYNWFNTTQTGSLPLSYRWRGRDASTDAELNPKTLTSGLDDYPRASHPTDEERHIDLRCWMLLASSTMAKIANILHKTDEAALYARTYELLNDPEKLDELHWNSELGIFSDYGNHSSRVQLQMKRFQQQARVVRVTKKQPTVGKLSTFGYVSLFPLLVKQLAPDSSRLHQLLQDLGEEDLLWTRYGLRSLSTRDPLYMKRNTQHDPPYWRGQIWININYLAVRALHHYAHQPGPHRQLAQDLYARLRENLVRNLYAQYRKSGYLWEQYNDRTGEGQGTHPFTGWSALVVLIMSEQY